MRFATLCILTFTNSYIMQKRCRNVNIFYRHSAPTPGLELQSETSNTFKYCELLHLLSHSNFRIAHSLPFRAATSCPALAGTEKVNSFRSKYTNSLSKHLFYALCSLRFCLMSCNKAAVKQTNKQHLPGAVKMRNMLLCFLIIIVLLLSWLNKTVYKRWLRSTVDHMVLVCPGDDCWICGNDFPFDLRHRWP